VYLEVGGRYHTIQVDLRGCSDDALGDLLFKEIVEFFCLMSEELLSLACSFSRFSLATGVELSKSSDVPGVRGVLADKPNDAKAPDPSPNADEAPPLVGEATLVVLKGAIPLRGLVLLLKDPSWP